MFFKPEWPDTAARSLDGIVEAVFKENVRHIALEFRLSSSISQIVVTLTVRGLRVG